MTRDYSDPTTNGAEHLPLDAKLALENGNRQPPAKKKTLGQGLNEIYFEYCSNSSLHGVQYLGQRRPLKEICFWLIIFVISLYYCSQTIAAIYEKWTDTPVIVSFAERSTPIYDIPFPAITICPETRRNARTGDPTYSQIMALLEEGNGFPENITSTQREEFLTLLHTCNYDSAEIQIERLSNYTIDYIRVLESMSVKIYDNDNLCKWFGIEDSCEDLFTTTYTEDGLCYTFNGYNGTDLYREDTVQYRQSFRPLQQIPNSERLNRTLTWSLGQGYPDNAPLKTYPARVVSASIRSSFLTILGMSPAALDYGCSGATQGYKIVLHTPDDVPLLSRRFVRLSPEKEVVIAVKPIMVTTSDGIAKHPAEKRKCFMSSERHLRFFKVYSEKNCEMECLTNYTLRSCDCVKFSMPRTADMPVCAEDKIACYLNAEEDMLLENFNGGGEASIKGCNCMPSCTSLEFDMEISQGDYNVSNVMANANFENEDGTIFSRLIVHFKEKEFITSKRSELYGFSDFLANCGGVLGLFMGFSILSVVEWVYHLTLRLWTNMRRKTNVE